jgi:hypothetical protein
VNASPLSTTPGSARVIQIVPRWFPDIDGVGSYAAKTGEALMRDARVPSVFLVASGNAKATADVVVLPERSAAGLQRMVERLLSKSSVANPDRILLHYVGYGYDKHGAPDWLADGLERIRFQNPELVLVTFFHEMYAKSWPWRRAFWFSLKQMQVAKRLLALSSQAVCSVAKNEKIILRWGRGHTPVTTLAIPSTIGEPDEAMLLPWQQRQNSIVVFGRPHTRELVYKHSAHIRRLCESLKIREIWDIGAPAPLSVDPNVPIRRLGRLSDSEISAALNQVRFGLIAYPSAYLGKSSILAAYAAHGLAPIVLDAGRSSGHDGLNDGVQYCSAGRVHKREIVLEDIAGNARRWYVSHGFSAHAAEFERILASSR